MKTKTRLLFLLILIFLIFSTLISPIISASDISKVYQDTLSSIDAIKETAKTNLAKPEYKPGELFKEGEDGKNDKSNKSGKKDRATYYTDNPSQVNYYQDGNAANLEKLARTEVMNTESYKAMNGNSIPNHGKAVMNNFSTRETYKVDKDSDFMKKSKVITDSAQNIVSGTSNQNVNCENKKVADCQIEYDEKTCNEEVRAIQRICYRVPKVEIYEEITKYPNCRKMDVRQGHRNYCSGGYRELLYTDVLDGPTYDDIFLCDQPVINDEANECYTGYMALGRYHRNNRRNDYGNSWAKGIVPKKVHGRMRFMHTYNGPLSGSIVNETKNQIYQSGSFAGGQTVELPYSKTEDQIFRFDVTNTQNHGFWSPSQVGVMVIYVDRVNHRKETRVGSWEEGDCYEI